MTTKRVVDKSTTLNKMGPRDAKVNNPDTEPNDDVPFRPLLDLQTQALIRRLMGVNRVSQGETVRNCIERFSKSLAASLPLAAYIRDEWPKVEERIITKEIPSKGMLFMIKKYQHDDIKALAWDTRWAVQGNLSRMLRIIVHFIAKEEGFSIPKGDLTPPPTRRGRKAGVKSPSKKKPA